MAEDDLLIERLLRVIDEGRRTATYKLALLLGIIEAVALSPGQDELPTRLIAERVVDLYYPQTREYVTMHAGRLELRQISMKSSPVVEAVRKLRRAGDEAGCRSADDCARVLPQQWATAVDAVEDTFVRYPIPLMQVVGARAVPFLYEIGWPEGTSVRALRRDGRDRLRLLPGVADRLAVLGPLLRPLVQMHWTADVARWSGVALEDDALHAHLFGTERTAFPKPLVVDLRELQDGACFYCGDRFTGRPEVDHFLAWSRWPNDAVENLVLADRCNGAKSDHLAAAPHVARWRERVERHGADLAGIAGKHRWPSAPDRTRALATTTYAHVSAGTPLWRQGKEFDIADGPLAVWGAWSGRSRLESCP